MLDVILIASGCGCSPPPSPMPTPAKGCEESGMPIDYILGSAVTLGCWSISSTRCCARALLGRPP
jgi:hypothetical protein